MPRKMVIMELKTGKCHYRTIKYDGSIRFSVEGHKLIIKEYHYGRILQSFDVSKYGSIKYWVED